MKKTYTFLFTLLIAFTLSGCATWHGIQEDSSNAWDNTKEISGDAWQKTKDFVTGN